MRGVRSGHRKVGWVAAVAVALALVGHALLMAGGGHPTVASTEPIGHRHGHHAADVPDHPRPLHGAQRAARSPAHAHGAVAARAIGVALESAPAGDGPADHTGGCGGVLTLARPQQLGGAAHVLPPVAVDPVVLPAPARRALASWQAPTAPPGTLRALLQVYRI